MKKGSFILISLCAAILLLTQCRPDPSGQSDTVDFKRTGNTAVVRLDLDPDYLNPVLSTNTYARQVMDHLFLYLASVDPQTLQFQPQLAKAMPVVEPITEGPYAGGVAYTFELHEAAVWDDGSPVTGHDYVFTLKTILNPKVPAQRYRPYLSAIRDIEIDPDNPRRFTVLTNQRYMLNQEVVTNIAPVLPAYIYDPDDLLTDIPFRDLADPETAARLAEEDERLAAFAEQFTDPKYSREKGTVAGCGPYALESWETGQRIVLNRKTDWWGDDLAEEYPLLRAHPDQLIFRPITDAVTMQAVIKSEEIDVASNIDTKDFLELRESEDVNARYNFYTPLSLSYFNLYLNTRLPKLSDRRVRRALAHAIDVDEVIETAYNGFGRRLANPVLPNAEYYNSDLEPIPFNLEKARSLLADAGWEDTDGDGVVEKEIDGERVPLRLEYMLSANREVSRTVALLIQDNARKAGIEVQLTPLEGNVIFDRLRSRNFEMAAAGRALSPTLWDPKQNWHSEGDNRSGFGDAETDALIDEIRTTLDAERRNELYKDLQARIYEETPEIFFFMPEQRMVVHKRFELEPTAIYPGYVPAHLKLKEEFAGKQ